MENASSNISTDLDDETLHNARLLREASKRGTVDEVKSLIEKLGRKNLDLTDNYFNTSALMNAAQFGHVDVVRILIDAGAKVDMDEKFDDHLFEWRSLAENGTALMRAAANGHTEVVNILIAANADVNGIALILAAEKGHLEIVNTLIAHKVDVDKINSWDNTALFLAAGSGHLEIVNSLIKAGAKLDESNPFGTALMRAAGSGHLEIVNSLIKAGAKVDANHHNDTALRCAASCGHFEIVKTLIAQNADVNKVNLEGASALTCAAKNGHIEVVKILIDQNADVDKVDKFGTAIMLAISKGHNDIVKLLLGKGANVNLTNKWGETALSCAVVADKEDNVEVVKLLLEKGAWTDSRHGDNDKTLLQIIAEKEIHTAEHLIIAKLLLEKGADLEKIGKKHELYPLLKIIGNLNDDEIKVVAENLKDFKTISNNAEAFRKPELSDDLTSKILMYTLDPKEPPYGLGEKLTLKIINLVQALKEPTNQFSSNDLRPPFLEPALTYAPPPISNQRSAQAPINSSLVPPVEPYDTGPRPTEPDSTFAPPPNRPNPRNFKFPPNSVVTADLVFAYEVQQEKPGTIPSGPSGVNIAKAVAKTAGLNDSRN